MKLNSFSLAALVMVLLFGGIGFTTAMNWWHTETTKVPAKYSEGEQAGQYNPADIRGSYTFGDVSTLFAVPLPDLQAAFRIPADQDAAAYPLKSLEAISAELPVEVGTASVRMFVAFYKGLPYDLSVSEETYLFPEAAAILKAQNKMQPEQTAYLESHLVPETSDEPTVVEATSVEPTAVAPTVVEPAAAGAAPVSEMTATPPATEHVVADKTVTGQTSFQNLLDWGVTQEAIEAILGDAMPAPETTIKNYLSQKGLEFSSFKTQFQAAVDQTK